MGGHRCPALSPWLPPSDTLLVGNGTCEAAQEQALPESWLHRLALAALSNWELSALCCRLLSPNPRAFLCTCSAEVPDGHVALDASSDAPRNPIGGAPTQVDEETEAMNLEQEAMWGEDSVPPPPPSSAAPAISRAFSQRLFLHCASSPLGGWEGSARHPFSSCSLGYMCKPQESLHKVQGITPDYSTHEAGSTRVEKEPKQPPATHLPLTFPVASLVLKAASRPTSERTEPLTHVCEHEVLGRAGCPSAPLTASL